MPDATADGTRDDRWYEGWYEDIVKTQIEPLLREYWFDRPKEAQRLLDEFMDNSPKPPPDA